MGKKPRVVLAFDFGLKNIGIAIGQEVTGSSETFYSLKAQNGRPNINELDKIINEWKPNILLVGDPINMDGSVSNMKVETDKFSKFIKKRYSIPVVLVDERLTTREAIERINSKREYLDKRYLDKHSISAQIILESWLREQN